MINLYLKHYIFPDKFKLEIINPLYKSGNKNNVLNYWPISLLCNFSKIVKSRLIAYLNKNNLVSKINLVSNLEKHN